MSKFFMQKHLGMKSHFNGQVIRVHTIVCLRNRSFILLSTFKLNAETPSLAVPICDNISCTMEQNK